ncbi:ketopantoate reductase family protein [Sphingomonas oryzagri]|uniref:2-dehydropantoate 2-reductase N-terminal domain-containing protein n=1 Tax=Sphingomonas oryzagri TaxID=3042314 RepID=A0ABT6N1Q6_9SPHN|nr:2-dehydropantoate 2-reductase N-terminal domain-containing protein [Sphingomonas oryzagri]MDH7639218.1 2-dehydropantoate 2-reductase N-terminal domain-containing protein [Sphingomonas oryzagri]
MRILVVGAGAVGGYFGGLWSAAGCDITFLAREARRVAIAQSGLTLVREGREIRTRPQAIIAADIRSPFDIVFLAVPGHAVVDAIAEIRPAIGPGSVIISSLNGVRHFDALREAYGADVVLGSVVKCVTTLDDMGRVVELAPVAEIAIGAWTGDTSQRLEAVRSCLAIEGLTVRVSPIIHEEIAEKWLMMVALGAANSLMGGNVGEINADPYGAWAIQEMLKEAHWALVEIDMSPRPAALDTLQRMLPPDRSDTERDPLKTLHGCTPFFGELDQPRGGFVRQRDRGQMEQFCILQKPARLFNHLLRLSIHIRSLLDTNASHQPGRVTEG